MGLVENYGIAYEILRKNPIIILPYFILNTIFITLAFLLIGFILNPKVLASISSFSLANPAASIIALIGGLVVFIALVVLLLLISIIVGLLFVGIYISCAEQGYNDKKVSLSVAFDVAKKNMLRLFLGDLGIFLIAIVIGVLFALGIF
ncbi:MAG: hypothetical protein ACHQX1_00740, partial [Candidatus Micrarchaeales archaeon]